jgi:DNA-binding transcriptional regulator GbsR (MarR family)
MNDKIVEIIDQIESEIKDFFTEMDTMLGRDPIISEIISQFYIHKILTQKQLQSLTGYSAGTISQKLQELVERGVIKEKKPKSARGPYKYSLPSIPIVLQSLFSSTVEQTLTFKDEFDKMRKKIPAFPNEIKETNLYQGIKEFLEFYFQVIPVYQEMKDKLKKFENL